MKIGPEAQNGRIGRARPGSPAVQQSACEKQESPMKPQHHHDLDLVLGVTHFNRPQAGCDLLAEALQGMMFEFRRARFSLRVSLRLAALKTPGRCRRENWSTGTLVSGNPKEPNAGYGSRQHGAICE
jgi:hypothetical protein